MVVVSTGVKPIVVCGTASMVGDNEIRRCRPSDASSTKALRAFDAWSYLCHQDEFFFLDKPIRSKYE